MNKLLCIILTLVLAMSLLAGCKKSENNTEAPTTAEQSEATESTNNDKNTEQEYDVPEPSDNKEVVTAEEAPDIYLILNSDDNAASISYHLKNCKLLSGAEAQKVAWEMIETLGFRQCPECNPPRYENYIE